MEATAEQVVLYNGKQVTSNAVRVAFKGRGRRGQVKARGEEAAATLHCLHSFVWGEVP